MKIEVTQGSSDPANSLMFVSKIPSTRPMCSIWEEDLMEILTDQQLKMYEKGQYILNVPIEKLQEKARTWFGRY